MKVSRYWKAIVATLVTGAGGVSTALNDDTITSAEASTIVIAVITAALATWAVPNKPAPASAAAPRGE